MRAFKSLRLIVSLLVMTILLSACGSEKTHKEKKASQALASVNGSEITMLQLNDELARAGVRGDQFEVASKQILESLIARQLIVEEAVRNKLDRTPEVMQARERASAQVIAQAYLQRITSKLDKPTSAEVEDFYQRKPAYFANRKQLDLTIVRIAASDLSSDLRAFVNAAKSIDEVTTWLDKHSVRHVRTVASRSTTDLPENTASMLLEKGKNHVFVMQEQNQNLLVAINSIQDSPVTLALATPQIERFLLNQKYKNATDEEVNRLRSAAKVDYFDDNTPNANLKESAGNAKSAESSSNIKHLESNGNNLVKSDALPAEHSIERGIASLK